MVANDQLLTAIEYIDTVSGEQHHIENDVGDQCPQQPVRQVDRGDHDAADELRQNEHDHLVGLLEGEFLALLGDVGQVDRSPQDIAREEERVERDVAPGEPGQLSDETEEQPASEEFFAREGHHDDLVLFFGLVGMEHTRPFVVLVVDLDHHRDEHGDGDHQHQVERDHGRDGGHHTDEFSAVQFRHARIATEKIAENLPVVGEAIGEDGEGQEQRPGTEHRPDGRGTLFARLGGNGCCHSVWHRHCQGQFVKHHLQAPFGSRRCTTAMYII